MASLGGRAVPSPSAGTAKPADAISLPQGLYWHISGLIGSTGVTLDPIFTQTIEAGTDPNAGAYLIQARDQSGTTLSTRNFTPVAAVIDELSTTNPPNTAFSQWIPVAAGAASFAILDPSGSVLSTTVLSGVAPVVTVTSPTSGSVGSSQQPITWTIADPDSSSFTSQVFYSVDRGATWNQIGQTTGTTLMVDFSQLPGTVTALVKVYASDGVNTGSALSSLFTVAKKLPSAIVINTPVSGATQPAADPVYLSGASYDADDGVLADSQLSWSSDVQGLLGTGADLTVSLKPGAQTITLTGTDSGGNVITATTMITLGGAAPTLSLTTSQATASCTDAVINVSPGAQGAALASVQYSLDGGAVYTNVPLNMLPFALQIPGSGSINLVATALDTSGQTAAQSTVLTLPIACAGGKLSAASGSNQSAAAGAIFAAPLKVIVADPVGNPLGGVSVSFAAPASGASATHSSSSVTTAADGSASVLATANASVGSYTVTATASSMGATASFALSNTAAPVAADFQLAAAKSSLTIARGSSATDTLTLTLAGGFNAAITLSCSGLPTGTTCMFSPASVTFQGASATTTLTIAAAQSASGNKLEHWPFRGGAVLCCLVGGVTFLGRRRQSILLSLILIAGVLPALVGCGGSTHMSSSVVTLTATSGTLAHTTTLSVTVE